jgi:superoxide dismutase, Cu-Zn family
MRPVLPLALAALLASPAMAQDAPAMAHVDLKDASGKSIGMAMISEAPNGVLMQIQASGLKPGWHGLHFHEKADCTTPDFKSAGGHVHDKATMVHGLLNPDANEAGDLPNLFVDARGAAQAEIFSTYVALKKSGKPQLQDADGSALVIHANPDDHKAQPIGGAGDRVACGSIK